MCMEPSLPLMAAGWDVDNLRDLFILIKRLIMQIRFAHSPEEVKYFTTEQLRERFLVSQLVRAHQAEQVYSH